MPTQPPSRTRSQRKRWALSQREIAFLLGLSSQGVISHHESQTRTPETRVLLTYEALFGIPTAELFPGLRQDVERKLASRAKVLQRRLGDDTSRAARRKSQFLEEVAQRLGPHKV